MAKELILSGHVQGVFCRRYCSEIAKKMNLHGSATNLSDGTVRVIIDSNDDRKTKEYIDALKHNTFGFKWYGSINEVSISDYNGSLHGDYIF